MPYVKHDLAFRAEAVALAAVIGLSAAAERLGIEERTLKSWMLKAGKDPADVIAPASWERLAGLALTKAERVIAEGKLSAAQLINAASMAEQRAAAKPATEAPTADERFLAWVDARYATPQERRLAVDCSCFLIIGSLLPSRTEHVEEREPTPAAGEAINARLRAYLESVTDLQAEYDRLLAIHEARRARERIIAARAVVLAQSGLAMHEAYAMAAELSDDHPMPEVPTL